MNKYFLGLCVCAFVYMPYSAMAGFQFTAPIAEQSTQAPSIQGGLLPGLPMDTPVMPAAPQIQVHSQAPIAPVAMPEPIVAPTPPAPVIITTPVAEPTKPIAITPSVSNEIAVGFGNDIPLTTALRQILPANYTYVLDQNIDGEQFVTWNGGREWPIVLNDMVQPLGLETSIDGQIVRITSKAQVEFQDSIIWNAAPLEQPQPQSIAPTNIVPAPQPAAPSAPSIMTLEDIEAKAIESLPTPPQNIIMQDFQTPQTSIVPDVSEGQWRAQNGDSLRTVIESWANIEGVDLYWSSEFDYKLAGDVNISGNFEQAIETLLSGFSEAQPRPTGRLHPNLPHGPAVLVVETRQKTS